PGENIGTSAIHNESIALSANYKLSYNGALLTIGKRSVTITADAKTKTYGDSDPALTYNVTTGTVVAGDNFSGSLTRVTGENIGTYAINQGSIALSPNYTLSYSGANLTINKRPITITADAKSKVYGSSDPNLTSKITSGNLVSPDQVTGALVRVAGQSVGNYAINQGTLTAGSNYDLTYINASFTITPASLTVKANDVMIYTGQTPVYSSTITGFVNGDVRAGVVNGEPTYTVSGDITKQGTYTITPSALPLVQPTNYTVGSYLTGTLTVNIDLSTVTAIRPVLRCVEALNGDPDGFKYLAKFEYINNNTMTVYIPVGPDNSINALGKYKAISQPEYFLPGTGTFNVKFNGEKLVWTITSWDKTKKTAFGSEASANSIRCKKSNGREAADPFSSADLLQSFNVHPNPATDLIRISFPVSTDMATVTKEDLKLHDQTGRITNIPVRLYPEESAAEMDARELAPGIYVLRIKHSSGFDTFKVIKVQ
ncbi:MAG: MBG domain-containing protein, partial [Bacteroidota bacterium]